MGRVLVVDDDPGVHTAINYAMKQLGHETIGAEDGQEGLEKAVNEKPDLILADKNMEPMDGYQMVTALKKDNRTWAIYVIGIGDFKPEEQEILDEYIPKSDYKRLHERISSLLQLE